MQGKFSVFVDNSMPSVAAALVPHYYIVVLGKQVDHTALALITPVDSHDHTIFHTRTSCIESDWYVFR